LREESPFKILGPKLCSLERGKGSVIARSIILAAVAMTATAFASSAQAYQLAVSQ